VKKQNWLNITEYLFLVGSGVGAIASVVSQQILFTAAPVSFLFLLNLVNRRRLEESTQAQTLTSVAHLDQKLSGDISSLQQQVQALPNFLDLASLRKALLAQVQDSVSPLTQEMAQLKQEVNKPEWKLLRQELKDLQTQYTTLAESLNSVTGQLNRLNHTSRVEHLEAALSHLKTELTQLRVNLQNVSEEQRAFNPRVLQDQINHLNRRLNKLPPPFDSNALKQDVDTLVRMVGEMASRRDLSRVEGQLEKLQQQESYLEQSMTPLKVATSILRKQLDTIAAKVQASEHVSDQLLQATLQRPTPAVDDLRAIVMSLEQRVNQLQTADLSTLRVEVQSMVATHLGQLQQQLMSVQQVTQSLDRQQKILRDWVNHLPQILDSTALENQVKYLAARVEWAETATMEVPSQVETAVKHHLEELTQQWQGDRPFSQHELIFDLKGAGTQGCGSRSILKQALQKAQARLILVSPYPDPDSLDSGMIDAFREFLNRNGCLDIGWGHLGDMTQSRFPRSLDRRRYPDSEEKDFLYDILNQLTLLKKQYPNQFRFKVLGTDENFLVCDRRFAILGAESMTTASVLFPQAAVGLRTTDPGVIRDLVGRYDQPQLAADDATAYFNRAATRFDLGDRPGAIADYTEVLRIQPTDDVARNNRGVIYYDQGDREGALTDFEQAVQQNSENFVAFFNRGMVRSEVGDRMGAIEDFSRAIHLNPDYTPAYFHRGAERTRLQNRIGAIQDYTEVIRLSPTDAAAHFYRGLAEIKIGQRAEAVRDLRQAAQLFHEQGDRRGYQQTVQTIKKLHQTLVISENTAALVSRTAG